MCSTSILIQLHKRPDYCYLTAYSNLLGNESKGEHLNVMLDISGFLLCMHALERYEGYPDSSHFLTLVA